MELRFCFLSCFLFIFVHHSHHSIHTFSIALNYNASCFCILLTTHNAQVFSASHARARVLPHNDATLFSCSKCQRKREIRYLAPSWTPLNLLYLNILINGWWNWRKKVRIHGAPAILRTQPYNRRI
jgi:hypothetical protein